MTKAIQVVLEFIYWHLLYNCAFVTSNSNNTCEVICLCPTPPDYWNQLKCCPDSLIQKKVANPHGVNAESNNPVADGNHMWNSPVNGQPLYDNPAADDYPMWNGLIDGGPMYDNPFDGRPMYDNPVDGRPMYDNPVDGRPMYDNPVDGRPMYDNPVADDYHMLNGPIDGGLMYDSPVDSGPIWNRPGDGGPMYDSPGDGGPIFDVPVDGGPMRKTPSDGGPMLDSRVAHESPVSTPSVRKPRSPSQGQGIRALRKRSNQVKIARNSSCVYPFVYTEPLHEEFKDYADRNTFRVFHGCLQKFIDSEMYLKCQDFRNVSSLERIIPVVDRKTEIIYANRFCAVCNDIKEVKTFNHEFICSNEILGHWDLISLEQTDENKIVQFQSGLCVYSLQPPDKKTMQAAGNRCLSAKYTNCNQAEDVALSSYDWDSYKITLNSLEDGKYCALCSYQSATKEYPDIEQSANNTVQGACNYRGCLNHRWDILSYSFFILMSLDKALPTKFDDRVLPSSDLTCGSQSFDVYDKYMVRNIPLSDL